MALKVGNVNSNPNATISLESAPEQIPDVLKSILDKLKTKQLSQTDIAALKERMISLDPAQWRALLEVYSKETPFTDPMEAISPLLSILSLEQIETAFQHKYATTTDALQAAKGMIEKAKDYFEKSEEKRMEPTLYLRIKNLIYTILNAFESLLAASGINDFFVPAENDMDATMKMHRMMMLCTLLSTLATLIVPLIGGISAATMGIIGGSVLALGVLAFVYYKFLRPTSHLPEGDNWNEEIENGKITVRDFNETEIDRIADKLIAHKIISLVGPSGVGKTEKARALVYNVIKEKYPALKGKKFFYYDTGKFATKTGGKWGDSEKILDKISKEMGADRENCVLILDEIQAACIDDKSVLSQRLKVFFDRGVTGFPNVIVLTTEQEFVKYILNEVGGALARRLLAGKISVGNMDEAQTLKVLERYLLTEEKDVLVAKGSLKYLYDQTKKFFPEDPQPYISCHLVLNRCIQEVKQGKALLSRQAQVDEVQNKIALLSAGSLLDGWEDGFPTGEEELQRAEMEIALQRQLAPLKKALETAKAQVEQLFEERKTVLKTKEKVYKSVLKLEKAKKESLSEKEQKKLKKFLLLSRFVVPAMESKLKKEAADLQIKVGINNELIDEVIKQIGDERAADARAREKSTESHKA